MFTTLFFIGCAMAAPLGNSFDANHSIVNLSPQDQPFVANSLDSSNKLSRRQDDDSIYFPDDEEDTGIRYPFGDEYTDYLKESSTEQEKYQNNNSDDGQDTSGIRYPFGDDHTDYLKESSDEQDQHTTGIRYPSGDDYKNHLLESQLEQERSKEDNEESPIFSRPSV